MQRTAGRAEIERWMVLYVAIVVGVDADDLDPGSPLASHDLDSVDAVNMALEFEDAFSLEIGPETFLDGDATLAAIAARVADAVPARVA